ncbi:UPF0503 protein At3g09070, chloroplastic-like [Asparagus officinalis]|uniref:UPF0503 protein At3g09070, chloroplastic-like n=1 Tax=Asparagus officinalis TaxID=4686 RepID=UPI00098DFDF6|nr:UPF0503 protein At3g09070, chloroplastic-like [Asparagus officinalis]
MKGQQQKSGKKAERKGELRPVKDHRAKDPGNLSPRGQNFWKASGIGGKTRRSKETKKKSKQQGTSTGGELARGFAESQPEPRSDGVRRRSCDLGPRFSLDAGRIPFDEPRLSLDIRSVRSRFHAPVPAIQRSDGQIPVEEDLMVPGSSKQAKNYYYYDSSSRSRRRSLDRSNSVKKFNLEMNEQKPASSGRVLLPAVRSESFRHSSSDAFVDDPPDSFRGKKSRKWSIWGLIHRQSTSSSRGGGGGDNVDCLRANEYIDGYNYNGRVSRSNSAVSLRRSCDYGNGGLGSMRKKGLGLERNGSLRDNNGYHLFTRS